MTTTTLIPESTFRPQNHDEEEAPPPYSASAEDTTSTDGLRTAQPQTPSQYQSPDHGHIPPLLLAPTRVPSAPSMTEDDYNHVRYEHPVAVAPSLTPEEEGLNEKRSAVVRPSSLPMTTTTNSWIHQEQPSTASSQATPLPQNTWHPRPSPSMSDVLAPPPPPQVALTQFNEIGGASVGGEPEAGPGLVMHYRCQDCGGQLSSETEVCKRLQCFSKTMRQSIKAQPGQLRQQINRPLALISAGGRKGEKGATESMEVPHNTAARSPSPSHPQPPMAYYASEPTRTSPATSYTSYSSTSAQHTPYGTSTPPAPYGTSTSHAPHGTSAPPAPYGTSSSSSSSLSGNNSLPQVLRSVSARSPVVSSVKKFLKDVRNEYRYQSGSASPSGYFKRPSSFHQHQSSQSLDYVVAPAPIPLGGPNATTLTYPPPPPMGYQGHQPPYSSAQAQAPLGRSGTDSGYPSRHAPSS